MSLELPSSSAYVGAVQDEPELTDARAMRALAHPVRLTLIDLLGYHDSLTATQASGLTGESPTNCAFHLRTLAKYGFLRESATASRRGRERPWTLTHRAARINVHQNDAQAARAAAALGQSMLERWLERARKLYSSPSQVSGWHEAAGWSQAHVFMTPGEARSVREQIDALLDGYDDRLAHPALRPPGAHPVEWTTFTMPVANWAADDDALPAEPDNREG